MIGICCWGVAVEISQNRLRDRVRAGSRSPMQCKDEGLVSRSLSDTVALCQLEVGFADRAGLRPTAQGKK